MIDDDDTNALTRWGCLACCDRRHGGCVRGNYPDHTGSCDEWKLDGERLAEIVEDAA